MAISGKSSTVCRQHGQVESQCSQCGNVSQTQTEILNSTLTVPTQSSADYQVSLAESSTVVSAPLPKFNGSGAQKSSPTPRLASSSTPDSDSLPSTNPVRPPHQNSDLRTTQSHQRVYHPRLNTIGAEQKYVMNRFLDESLDFRTWGCLLLEGQELSDNMAVRNRMHRIALAQRVRALDRRIGV